MHHIELGTKVRDSVSGWTGVATARYEYMNGCERYEVSGADKDGAPIGHVFDVQQIEVDAGDRDEFGQVTWVPTSMAAEPLGDMLAEVGRNRYGRSGGPRDSRPVVR